MYRRGPGAFSYPARGGYYGRRRDPYQDQQAIRLILALVHQILMMERKPPVSLAILAINVLAYLKPKGLLSDILPRIPSIRAGCLQPAKILFGGEWSRLFSSPFLHQDDLHLYYNMASLLWKGSVLEPVMGSVAFTALILELLVFSGLIYVGITSFAVSQGLWFGQRAFNSCAIGFSGVLFGLKVVLNAQSPGWTSIAGFSLPTKYAAWAELVLISIITPNTSFLGHLAGILAGLLHVYVITKVVERVKFEYRRNVARQQQQQRRNVHGSGNSGNRSGGGAAYANRARTWGSGTWGS